VLSFLVSYQFLLSLVSCQYKSYCSPIPFNPGDRPSGPLVDFNEPIPRESIRKPHFINLTWPVLKTQRYQIWVPLRGFKPTTNQCVFACITCITCICLCCFQSHTKLNIIVLVQSQETKLMVLGPTTVPLSIRTNLSPRYP